MKRSSSTRGGGRSTEPLLEMDMWAKKRKVVIKAYDKEDRMQVKVEA